MASSADLLNHEHPILFTNCTVCNLSLCHILQCSVECQLFKVHSRLFLCISQTTAPYLSPFLWYSNTFQCSTSTNLKFGGLQLFTSNVFCFCLFHIKNYALDEE
ncbi:hypothetical protein V8G54_026131 [Vigna mungo]|uniref:Uncharacterized protein n=1 Tax=Vigna mungo TaxID=3915 RepID=A0AAQ3RMX5_VIGMU